MAQTAKPAKKSSAPRKSSGTFSAEEKAAMREYAREKKAASAGADGESEALAAIAKMPDADRVLAERIHAIVKEQAPDLAARTWYGMPAYANKAGKVVCFFQNASKFKARYATLGFSDNAGLDDGNVWPTSYAVAKLTPADEKRIAELVRKAIG